MRQLSHKCCAKFELTHQGRPKHRCLCERKVIIIELTHDISENPLGHRPIGELLRKFAVPSIIAMLVGALYNIVDQIFIGQKIGELGNSATNVAFPLSISCIAVALLLGIGGAAAFNLSVGAGDKEKAAYYVGNSSVMLVVLGAVLAVVTLAFLTPLLRFFGSPDNVLGYAEEYTRITALGFPFLVFANGGGHLIRADGSPKYSMLCNLSGAIVNTILDPIFIFTLDMDMTGAALATVIGQFVSFVMAYIYMRRFKTVRIKRRHLIPRLPYLNRIMALGAAPSFNQLAMMIVQIVMNKSLTHYGSLSIYGESIPLASAGIVSKVAMLFFSVIIGISQGMQPIASFNYGAQKYDRVKKVYKLAIISGSIVALGAFLIFQLTPRPIVSLFGLGSELYYSFTIAYFRIFMFFTFLNCIQPVSSNFFTAIGKPKKGVFLSLTRQIIFLLPLIVLLPLFLGIDGIMYAGPVADFAAFAVSLVMIASEFKIIDKLSEK